MRGIVVAVLAVTALGVGGASAAGCPLDQPVIKDITAEAFYTDKAFSVLDQAVVDRNKASLAVLDKSLWVLTSHSDRYLKTGAVEEARCALAMLTRQAAGGAMLGTMSSRQAGYERKWRTAGVAMVYLALKDQAQPDERATIEPWLKALGDHVEQMDTKPKDWNNHHYWIGFVATAVGAATGDAARFARGRKDFDDGLKAIEADGTLPREMGRAGRSLHYHNYALAPLVLTAEIAARQGEDWYSREGGALHRLAARVAAGMVDPGWFTARTGVQTEVPGGGVMSWRAFYERRFPGRIQMPPTEPMRYTSFGGDMAALAQRWIQEAPAKK